MVAVCCFVWSLALQMWSVSEWGKFWVFVIFKKFDIQLCFLVQYLILGVIKWFFSYKMSLGWFIEVAFLAVGATIAPIHTYKQYYCTIWYKGARLVSIPTQNIICPGQYKTMANY